MLSLVAMTVAACGDGCVPLVSFAADAPKELQHSWSALNDPVMGGRSTSSVSVDDGLLNFTGHCAIVPSLKAPGFITAVTGRGFFSRETFVDVSSCEGLTIEAKDYTSGYQGYRISFGTAKPPGGKFFAQGYKADLHPTVGTFGSVSIPFTNFTDFWDECAAHTPHRAARSVSTHHPSVPPAPARTPLLRLARPALLCSPPPRWLRPVFFAAPPARPSTRAPRRRRTAPIRAR